MFLLELSLQCQLATRYTEHLEKAAAHWIALENGIDDGGKSPPIDIVACCAVCLSAMAAIRRLLFVGGRANHSVRKRCAALLDLLGNPALPNLRAAEVRNSWEHFDERLDALLATRVSGAVSQIHISAKPADATTTVLRRFDPVGFAIHFTSETIALRPCVEEVKVLASRVSDAFARLRQEKADV